MHIFKVRMFYQELLSNFFKMPATVFPIFCDGNKVETCGSHHTEVSARGGKRGNINTSYKIG